MVNKNQKSANVSIRALPNTPLGWMTAQSLFNQSPQTGREFFGHDATGEEGRAFFERIFADTAAQKIELFEILLNTDVTQSVGLITLGSGYADSTAAYIHFMFVTDSQRGRGIGCEAVRQLETHSKNTCSHMTLVVALPRNSVTRFWTRLGYVQCGGLDANLMESVQDAIVEKLVKQISEPILAMAA